MSTRLTLTTTLALVVLGTAACTGGTGAGPTSAPATEAPGASASPATAEPSPTIEGAIAHPTGADEIVLRMEDAGGFTPPEWQAARLPYFTLYGDGRVVYQQTTAEVPARSDNVFVGVPLRTGVLDEQQIQDLLAYALGEGGLAIAKPEYHNNMVADAPTTTFTVSAEGDTKTVSVNALGFEGQPGPDSAVLAQLAELGERLRDFDQGGSYPSDPYLAPAYRGVILEQQGVQGVTVRDWPWDDLEPSDFAMPADADALQMGTHTLTPEQAAAVGVEGFENGVASGVYLRAEDGAVYSLVIRPLLPADTA
jgi:hypothetical protein